MSVNARVVFENILAPNKSVEEEGDESIYQALSKNKHNNMSANEPVDEENALALGKPVEEEGPVEDEFEESKAWIQWSRRKRLALGICVLLMVVIGVVLGVTLAPKTNNQETTSAASEVGEKGLEEPAEPLVDTGEQITVQGGASGGEVQSPPSLRVQSPPSEVVQGGAYGGEVQSPPSVQSPTSDVQRPPSEVKRSPTEKQSPVVDEELAQELTQFYVIEALNVEGCTNPNLLRDPTTSQGEVVKLLVEEIMMVMDYNEDGTFFIPLNMGKGYIRDRYALIRLYQEAGGEQWITATNWMSPMNQCSWFGVEDCVPYTSDNCGVRALSLDTNHLGSSLPQDLCCMKCLQTISLIGPSASSASSLPQCLASSEVHVNIMPITETSEVQRPPPEVQRPPTEIQSQSVDKELVHELTKFFVIAALDVEGCTKPNLLRDPTTMQGEVVELLVQEVMMAMDYNEDGTFYIPLHMGKGYIQDRYALIRLYQEAGGEQWVTETNWMSPMSQCSWFGVADCVPYTLDNCGVRALSLDTNDLGSSLPQDLCCMKCLQTISLVGPSISSASSPPQCLASSEVQVNILPIAELASQP